LGRAALEVLNAERDSSVNPPSSRFARSRAISMVFAVGGCLWAAGAAFGGAPAGLAARTGSLRGAVMSADGVSRREMMQSGSAAVAAAAASGSFLPQAASAKGPVTGWQTVDLPIATESPILFDIDFDPQNPSNGWICGNKGTFLQTKDGGKSWAAKSFANLDPDEEINYRFTKMSWINGEGWIIGKPAILLHSKDSGEHPPCRHRRHRCGCRRAAATASPYPILSPPTSEPNLPPPSPPSTPLTSPAPPTRWLVGARAALSQAAR
jgi:hypothetical protein